MSERPRIAIVVQRYGDDIIGGAEAHARLLAEHLAADGRYAVEVLTTTSRSADWDDVYPVGGASLNGLQIRRFRSERPRAAWFPWIHQLAKLKNLAAARGLVPVGAADAFETLWYRAQGPYCPTLIEQLAADRDRYRCVLFFTYLYFPTVLGLPVVAERALLIPTAHDEPALQHRATRRLFRVARSILVNTAAERDLVLGLDASLTAKIRLAGIGIDVPPGLPAVVQPAGPRFGLYLGRIGRAKGLDRLLRMYDHLRRSGAVDWDLCLVGALDGDVTVDQIPGVRFLGQVDEAAKWRLISQAAFIVNPSAHESMSLATLEALAALRPVVLSRACAVFRRYAAELPTAYLYESSDDLVAAANAAVTAGMENREKSRAWVLERHGWPRVLATYVDAIESV